MGLPIGREDERGGVLLEFGMVLPFLLLFLVGSIEFSRVLRAKEMMAAVGREATNQAFRQCGADTAPRACNAAISTADACLVRVHGAMIGLARAALGGSGKFHFTTSTYGYDAVTDSVIALGITRDATGVADASNFDAAYIQANYLDLMRQNKVIAITEVWYDFEPFFDVPWLRPGTFYEATIY